MRDWNLIFPRLSILAVAALLVAAGVSCKTVTLGPKFQHYSVDVEFDGAFLGVPTGTYEADFDYASLGLECAWQAAPQLELFIDLGFAAAAEEDYDVGIDGSAVGFGIRSPDPSEPGWGIEWALRGHSHEMASEDTIATVRYDTEFVGSGTDLNVGVYHALSLESDLLFTASLGVWAKSLSGEWTADLLGIEMLDIDYEFNSEAVYAGITLAQAAESGIDLSAYYYQGTESLRGMIVSAGFKF